MEIGLIDFSSGVEISMIFTGGIEFDLALVLGSKVIWSL